MTEIPRDRHEPDARQANSDPLRLVREALSGMRFGAIQLTVHEGKLVQMDVTEKRRFT